MPDKPIPYTREELNKVTHLHCYAVDNYSLFPAMFTPGETYAVQRDREEINVWHVSDNKGHMRVICKEPHPKFIVGHTESMPLATTTSYAYFHPVVDTADQGSVEKGSNVLSELKTYAEAATFPNAAYEQLCSTFPTAVRDWCTENGYDVEHVRTDIQTHNSALRRYRIDVLYRLPTPPDNLFYRLSYMVAPAHASGDTVDEVFKNLDGRLTFLKQDAERLTGLLKRCNEEA